MIYQKTPNGTNRLFLYRKEMPDNQTQLGMLFAALDMYCIWGGTDNRNDDYISWEFDACIKENIIRQALNRAGCKLNNLYGMRLDN
jgi:hypothetical protein